MIAEKTIQKIIEEARSTLPTPCYLIDEARLLQNLEKIRLVRSRSGAKAVLALKCFSTWSVFDFMKPYMDGTTSSSAFEARLGAEKFGKETHAYSVAWSDEEITRVKEFASKIIFNSLSQLERYHALVKHLPLGLRVNPGVSFSHFDLADPARPQSRLGERDLNLILKSAGLISGVMFHFNCENDDFEVFSKHLDHIENKFGTLLKRLKWVSLGGGIYFTKDGYPIEAFADKLLEFSKRFNIQVYLEPGETAVTRSGFFVTKVLDIVKNDIDIAIVDSAVETHLLDLLIYRTDAKIEMETEPGKTAHRMAIAGRTCLAGDIFGVYDFPEKLKIGSLIPFSDAAGYTMVKKNWFNGVQMPSIAIRRIDGKIDIVKNFTYEDYKSSLS